MRDTTILRRTFFGVALVAAFNAGMWVPVSYTPSYLLRIVAWGLIALIAAAVVWGGIRHA